MNVLTRASFFTIVACAFMTTVTQDAHAQVTLNIFDYNGNPIAGDIIYFQATITGLKPNTRYSIDVYLYVGQNDQGEIAGGQAYAFTTDANGNATLDSDVPDDYGIEWSLQAVNTKGNAKDFNTIVWQIYDFGAGAETGPAVSAILEVSPKP